MLGDWVLAFKLFTVLLGVCLVLCIGLFVYACIKVSGECSRREERMEKYPCPKEYEPKEVRDGMRNLP